MSRVPEWSRGRPVEPGQRWSLGQEANLPPGRSQGHPTATLAVEDRLLEFGSWIPKSILPSWTKPPDLPLLRVAAVAIPFAQFRRRFRRNVPVAPCDVRATVVAEVHAGRKWPQHLARSIGPL